MTIEKHGNKWRVSEMRDGIRYRVTVDHKPGRKEAHDLIHDAVQNSDSSICKRETFEYHAREYIEIKSNILSPSTKRGYLSMLSNLSDTFKKMKTADLNQKIIQEEINNYSATHSPKSTHNLHGFISSVLAVYRPSLRISTTLPQKRLYEASTPSEEHIQKLLQEVAGTEYEIPIRLGCYGLRRGEICAISEKDIDGNMLYISKSKVLNEKGEWIIKPFPKTTKSQRTIYIDSHLADLIRQRGCAYSDHPNRLNHTLHRLQKRLNLPPFRFHDLRAYYASMAHLMGIPDAYIMANGGWSSTNILNRVYKRTFDDAKNDANRQIAERLSAPSIAPKSLKRPN